MAQMTTVWQIQAHQSVVRPHQSLVHLQIGRAPGQALHVDTPFLRVEVERLERAALAGQFDGVDVLVTTVVTSSGVALGVLVGHGRAERIVDGAGRHVL